VALTLPVLVRAALLVVVSKLMIKSLAVAQQVLPAVVLQQASMVVEAKVVQHIAQALVLPVVLVHLTVVVEVAVVPPLPVLVLELLALEDTHSWNGCNTRLFVKDTEEREQNGNRNCYYEASPSGRL